MNIIVVRTSVMQLILILTTGKRLNVKNNVADEVYNKEREGEELTLVVEERKRPLSTIT